MTAPPAISTTALTKDYGSAHGLFGLDLAVEAGEVFGFLGPNGAGKSTTIRLLLGLIRPTSGSASLLGLDSISGGLEIRRRIGFLPSEPALYPRLTGRTMLAHLAALRGHGTAGGREAEQLAERFGAELDRPVRELSRGNRQKLGLIQAFMHRPELVILDEPIAGLDPLVQNSFHELLLERSRAGVTVFLSSHSLSEVEHVATRVAVLRRGRAVIVDTLENLRRVAVQRLDIEFETPVDPAAFRELGTVREVSARGPVLSIAYEGGADEVVKAAARFQVRALHPRQSELEDIFLRYYQDEAPG